MRKLKKNLISTSGFLLLIALTVAIYYLLPYEKLLMDKTTLFGVIVSEVITLLGTLFYNTVSGKKKLTMTAGGYTILFGYQALVFILSILFAFYYRNKNVRKYWVFWLKCRYSVGINRDVYTFITSFDCRKQPLFR